MSTPPGNVHIALGVIELIQRAQSSSESSCHGYLGINHLLLEVWDYSPLAVERLADIDDIDGYMLSLKDIVADGGIGDPVDVDQLLKSVQSRVAARGEEMAKLTDFIHAVLEKAGLWIKAVGDLERQGNCEPAAEQPAGDRKPDTPHSAGLIRMKPSIPTLLQFGTDLTLAAREGKLLPVVGRDAEVQLMLETLCRRTKRNPMLVGPAGVGKTAIVEGFAQRVVRGEVPGLLADTTVIMLQPSLIVSGGGTYGELEERMNSILAEATQDGVILFIDEVHSIVGAGGAAGRADIASLMKPALARGDIACIAATTDEEFRKYIEPDSALERRFQSIRVQEMNTVQVFSVLQELRDDLKISREVDVFDEVLHRLIDYAEKYMRNRTFPDKALDLLEQCVANALARGDRDVDATDATIVVERMVGMPLDIGARIEKMHQTLVERLLLSEVDSESLSGRLQVTMRGLDIRPVRPNAVILLAGKVANGVTFAESISSALFETTDRIVKIDAGRFTHHNDITLLLGAPPSYVGYNETMPIHSIKQCPWCVVLIENLDVCHQGVQQVLGQALEDGYFTDGQNKKIYLSDAVVVLSAPGIERKHTRIVGFVTESNECRDRDLLRRHLDPSIIDAVDIICFENEGNTTEWVDWLRSGVLREVSERFGKLGVTLHWDDSIFEWIKLNCTDHTCRGELERLIETRLSPEIVLKVSNKTCSPIEFMITFDKGEIRIFQSRLQKI